MMARKIYVSILVILFVSHYSYTQKTEITKIQMYEDFDYLTNLINETNPYLDVKKQLWNYNISDSISSYRKSIDDCKDTHDFHALIFKIMNTCVDGHAAVYTPMNWPNVNLYIPMVYQDGEYLIKRDFQYKSIPFKAGSKLIAINGNKNIHHEVAQQIPYRYLMRWDVDKKQFYSENFYLSSKYIKAGSIELEFEWNNKATITHFDYNDSIDIPQSKSIDNKQVRYFDQHKILYIRIPTMNWSDKRFYQKEISKMAKGKEIDKVIIDVRYNMGGSSLIGRNVFRALLPEAIWLSTRVYGNSPKNLSKNYVKTHLFDKQIRKVKLSELDSIEMFKYADKIEKIKPFKNSIKHNGDIYIIGNEHIYSAGGAIFMFANHAENDKIYSIGTPTGWFLGEFSDPIHFTLPNSKLEVGISPTMSMSHVTSLDNVMLDSYDYIIYPTIDDYKKLHDTRDTMYSEKYLINDDPYLKPILQESKR